jgi:glycosyltransferase involved in cell wall biosynthesis
MPNKLSIIIPAQNEEKRIARTLSSYGSFFENKADQLHTEIIVVINGSSDRTAQIVDEYSHKYPFIKRLETKYSPGKGGAVALGFKEATGDFIGYFDADGAVSALEILKLYNFIEETPWLDGVVGTRVKSSTEISLKRRFLSRVYNLYVKLLFNLPYSDTQCAAKIFRSKPAKGMAQKLSNTGWGFDVNLLLVAKYLNYRIIEQPVVWLEKEGSKFSWLVGVVSAPLELIKLKNLEISYQFGKGVGRFIKSDEGTGKPVKRVLIFAWRDIKHPEMGGSEIYVHEIAKRLTKGYKVVLFTSKPGNLNHKDTIDGVKIVRRGNFVTVYFWAFVYYVFYFRKICDLIIDVENGLPFFTPLYSGKPKIMLLHHLHKGQWFKQYPFPVAIVGYLLESFVVPLLYRPIRIVTISPSTLSELVKAGLPQKSIFIAYNSIPSKVGGNFKKSDFPLLLYIGRIKAYKRIEIALETLKSVRSIYPGTKLVVAGLGDHLEALKLYAEKLKVASYVDFVGFVSEKQKWELYQRAWVFLMPSIKEGWGITVIEAASCGLPTLGFNVPGVKDSVVDGQTGLLASDIHDYYSEAARLIDDSKLRKTMSAKCKGWASNFSWDKSATVFDKVIKQGLGRDLLSNKVYPWDLELKTDSLTSLDFTK